MVLKFELQDILEHKFREVAMKKYGYRKGSLLKATEEALNNWIAQQSREMPKIEDPFKLITGILSHLKGKKTSIELQHEGTKVWTKCS